MTRTIKGSVAPTTTPERVGTIFVDSTGGEAYISVGTSSSADWKQITN